MRVKRRQKPELRLGGSISPRYSIGPYPKGARAYYRSVRIRRGLGLIGVSHVSSFARESIQRIRDLWMNHFEVKSEIRTFRGEMFEWADTDERAFEEEKETGEGR